MRIQLPSARVLAVLFLLAACKSTPESSPPVGELEVAQMNHAKDPGVDFYEYANGGWLATAEIPPEEASWGMAAEVRDRNRALLRAILEEAAEDPGGPGSLTQKLGDFWATGMNEAAIEALAAEPLAADLARIEGIENGLDFARVVARLHSLGAGPLFGLGAEAGLQDPTTTMAWMVQGGLGLPDRDYYTREDEESIGLREQYRAHVQRMFMLLGAEELDARDDAGRVLLLETRLARKSLTSVEMRNPQNFDRLVTLAQVGEEVPNFDWRTYLAQVGLEDVEELNMPMPEFWAELNALLVEAKLADWKAYLRWHLVAGLSGSLSADFERESFRFYGTVLAGTPEMEPRWKRVLGATGRAMDEALGQLYVRRAFSPAAKERAGAMVAQLLDVMRERIQRVDWMSPETKEQALVKLDGFGWKIGYPDEWRDWSGLEIRRDTYAANVMRASEFDFRWQMSKVGRPVDPDEWGMPPQMLNAYYHPLRNEIVFPAAILQPPFFGEQLDDPLNYGAIGAVIGHEITHGFDDSGSQFDAEGRLRNWWTDADRTEFEARTRRLIEQYGAYEPLPGVRVNGELTLGENIADLGGLSIALEAMQRANEGIADPMLGGFTREQRFFLAFGRVWRSLMRDEAMKLMVNTNPHSPPMYRAIGPLGNMPAFAAAFELGEDAPMVIPASARAEIW